MVTRWNDIEEALYFHDTPDHLRQDLALIGRRMTDLRRLLDKCRDDEYAKRIAYEAAIDILGEARWEVRNTYAHLTRPARKQRQKERAHETRVARIVKLAAELRLDYDVYADSITIHTTRF